MHLPHQTGDRAQPRNPGSCQRTRTTPTSPSTRASISSFEDVRCGMSRGTNHSTQEVTRDTGREQEAQVGRPKAPPITRSTGLRRRERRFESCRGHHVLPACIAQSHRYEQALARSRGMVRGTNSFHEPLHTRLATLAAARKTAAHRVKTLVRALLGCSPQQYSRLRHPLRGAVLPVYARTPQFLRPGRPHSM